MRHNIYEKRAELSTALQLQKQIDALKDTLVDHRITGGVSSSKITGAPHSKNNLSNEDMLNEIEGNIEQLEAERDIEATLILRQIEKHSLPDRERNLLLYRYVRCLPWKQVRSLLGLSKTHTYRLENEILLKI